MLDRLGWCVCRRELKLAAGSGREYLLRSLFVLLPALALTRPWELPPQPRWPGATITRMELAHLGSLWYRVLLATELDLAVLVMPLLTAALILRERQRNTLELLLLSGLDARAIVCGKFAAGVLRLASALVLTAPVLVGVWSLGAASPGALLADQAVVLACAAWVGAVGLFMSATCRSLFGALTCTLVVLLPQMLVANSVLLDLGLFHVADWRLWIFGPMPYAVSCFSVAIPLDPELGRMGGWALGFWVLMAVVLLRWAALEIGRSPTVRAGVPDAAGQLRASLLYRWGVDRVAAVFGWLLVFSGITYVFAETPWVAHVVGGIALLPVIVIGALMIRWVLDPPGAGGTAGPGRGSGQVWDDAPAWRAIVLGRTPGRRRLLDGILLLLAFGAFQLCENRARSFWLMDRTAGVHDGFLALETLLAVLFVIAWAGPAVAEDLTGERREILALTGLSAEAFLRGHWKGVVVAAAPALGVLLVQLAVSAIGGSVFSASDLVLRLLVTGCIVYFHGALGMHLGVRLRGGAGAVVVHLGLLLILPLLSSVPQVSGSLAQLRWFVPDSGTLGVFYAPFAPGAAAGQPGLLLPLRAVEHALIGYLVAGVTLHVWTLARIDALWKARSR